MIDANEKMWNRGFHVSEPGFGVKVVYMQLLYRYVFPESFYSLVTLTDNQFAAGFGGSMRASLLIEKSPSGRKIKVIVGSPSKASDGSVIKLPRS